MTLDKLTNIEETVNILQRNQYDIAQETKALGTKIEEVLHAQKAIRQELADFSNKAQKHLKHFAPTLPPDPTPIAIDDPPITRSPNPRRYTKRSKRKLEEK